MFLGCLCVVCRTVRWLDRCIAAHKRPNDQNLFPIVQGGLDANLRVQCAKGTLKFIQNCACSWK